MQSEDFWSIKMGLAPHRGLMSNTWDFSNKHVHHSCLRPVLPKDCPLKGGVVLWWKPSALIHQIPNISRWWCIQNNPMAPSRRHPAEESCCEAEQKLKQGVRQKVESNLNTCLGCFTMVFLMFRWRVLCDSSEDHKPISWFSCRFCLSWRWHQQSPWSRWDVLTSGNLGVEKSFISVFGVVCSIYIYISCFLAFVFIPWKWVTIETDLL